MAKRLLSRILEVSENTVKKVAGIRVVGGGDGTRQF